MLEEVKSMHVGTVIWFNRSYGFIAWNKDGVPQTDLFCHFSDLDLPGYRTLAKDQKVSFELGTNHKNQPKAIAVKIIT